MVHRFSLASLPNDSLSGPPQGLLLGTGGRLKNLWKWS